MALGFIAGVMLIGAQACQNGVRLGANEDQAAASAPIGASDLKTIMAWWDGDYDNDDQIAALRADGAPIWQRGEKGEGIGGHLPVVSHYRPIDMPVFGENVLYVEEKTFGDDGNPYRQRFYTLSLDEDKNTISVKLWYFKDRKAYLGAWQDLSRVSALTPDDMSPLPDNCDLNVTRMSDGRYHMKMPVNGCVFGEKLFDYQVILGPDSFWFRDRIANSKTGIVEMSAGAFTYHKLDKR